MRFISRTGRPDISVQREIVENYATGASRTIQRALIARFREGLLTPDERELAISHWQFNGLYQEQDEVTMVQPDYRIGLFDSEEAQLTSGWTDEERELVEATLIHHSQNWDEIMVVPRVFIPPPWPRYEEFTGSPKELVHKLVEDGHDLDATLTYEKASQNRPAVLAAITMAIEEGLPFVDEFAEEEVLG